MALNQNLAHIWNSSPLTFYSINSVLISHVIYHVIILGKIINYRPVGGWFKKRNRAIPSFLFILNISNTLRLEWASMTLQEKIMRKTSFLMSNFNLQLLKTWILNFAHIHSKGRNLGMFILFQSKFPPIRQFPTDSPPVGQFPCLNVETQEHLKVYFWGKIILF